MRDFRRTMEAEKVRTYGVYEILVDVGRAAQTEKFPE